MPNRIGKSTLPKVEIIDMANEMKQRNMIFSSTLNIEFSENLIKSE